MAKSKKYYVVWAGRRTGVFASWDEAKQQVEQFPGARHKAFKSEAEAKAAYAGGVSGSGTAKTSVTRKKMPREKTAANVKKDAALDAYDVVIYCDGACDPNPGQSSSGLSVYRDGELSELWYGLYNSEGTNNSAELNALHQSLLIAKVEIEQSRTVQIRCDSKYSINCMTVWAFNWKKKGWKRNKNDEIKNLDIIQKGHALYLELADDVSVEHVKAHIGIEGNELADRMAVYGIMRRAQEFCRYTDKLDVKALLEIRPG